MCSGNHDDTGRLITADRAPIYEWFARLRDDPKITTDGSTQVIDNLIVTTVPYDSSTPEKAIWLDRGRSIRMKRGGQWLVLHHVPPSVGPNVSGEEREAAGILYSCLSTGLFLGRAYPSVPVPKRKRAR